MMRAELTDAQFAACCRRTLLDMPRTRRDIFLFVRIEGHSHAEAAALYGVSQARVGREISRAMLDLRRATRPQDFTLWRRLWPL
jgi:DNA-directed RNA polymerase specialized sigma24 family protein